jgi:hypothetical protein
VILKLTSEGFRAASKIWKQLRLPWKGVNPVKKNASCMRKIDIKMCKIFDLDFKF